MNKYVAIELLLKGKQDLHYFSELLTSLSHLTVQLRGHRGNHSAPKRHHNPVFEVSISFLLLVHRCAYTCGDLDADLHMLSRQGVLNVRHLGRPVFHQHLSTQCEAGLGGLRFFPRTDPPSIEILPICHSSHRSYFPGDRVQICK